MDLTKRMSLTLLCSVITEIHQIAQFEGRPAAEVARILLKAGLRAYRRGRPLLCGYPNCTRKDCCGGEGLRRDGVLRFPGPHH